MHKLLLLAPVFSNAEDWTFAKFLSQHQKKYTEAELPRRKEIFERNLAEIEKHNALNVSSYQMGVNQFTDLTSEEFAAYLGRKGSKLPLPTERTSLASTGSFPPSIDWRTKGVISPVKDQGACGSCWAFASTANIESYVALSGAPLPVLAPQQLVSCSKNPQQCGGTGGCGGSIAELAYDYVQANGMVLEKNYPYTARDSPCNQSAIATPAATLTGHVRLVQNDYNSVMQALSTIGPLAVNVWAIPFQSYRSGIFNGCSYKASMDIDHVVQLVGYGTDSGKDYWIIRNSWGPGWGENGFMRMAREGPQTLATCGLDMTPADGTACQGDAAVVGVCGQCGVLYDASYPTGVKAK